MDKILLLQQSRAKAIEEMRGLVDKADAEKRNLNEEEEKRYTEMKDSVPAIDAAIKREQDLRGLEGTVQHTEPNFTITKTTDVPDGDDGEGDGFRNLGEYFYTIATNRSDPRLNRLRVFEQRASQQAGVGALGGFNIPERYESKILSISPQEALIRPRATTIPAGSPPDAKLSIPALDQGAARNMYGGVVIYHKGEEAALTETNVYFKQITFEPHKMTGLIKVTNDLLANWDACSTFMQNQLKIAMNGSEDYDFLRGDGAAKAQGVLNADCKITYARATASQISYADVTGMYARAKFGGSLVWIASQTTITQLVNIRDTGNNNLWHASATEGVPPTLMGFPVLWAERCPALGTEGDLILADLSYYVIKDGSGPRVDISTDVYFTTDCTAFRIVWNVDAHPWLSEAIPLEGSTSNTVSI